MNNEIIIKADRRRVENIFEVYLSLLDALDTLGKDADAAKRGELLIRIRTVESVFDALNVWPVFDAYRAK